MLAYAIASFFISLALGWVVFFTTSPGRWSHIAFVAAVTMFITTAVLWMRIKLYSEPGLDEREDRSDDRLGGQAASEIGHGEGPGRNGQSRAGGDDATRRAAALAMHAEEPADGGGLGEGPGR